MMNPWFNFGGRMSSKFALRCAKSLCQQYCLSVQQLIWKLEHTLAVHSMLFLHVAIATKSSKAAPQLVHTVFRSADRNVSGQQQVSAAVEDSVQPDSEAAKDLVQSEVSAAWGAPNSESNLEPPDQQADSESRGVNFNAKTVNLYAYCFHIHEYLAIFLNIYDTV